MQRKSLLRIAIPLTVFLLTALFIMLPVLKAPSRLSIGEDYIDKWLVLWESWLIKQHISEGRSHLQTDYIFYPAGIKTSTILGHPFYFLFTVPLQLVWNVVLAYNLEVFLALIFNGLAGYYLVKYKTGSAGIALLAGIIFQINPYSLKQLQFSLLESAFIGFVLFYALALEKSMDRGGKKEYLSAAVCLFLITISNSYYAVYAYIYTAFRLLYSLALSPRDFLTSRNLRSLAVFCAVYILAALPYIFITARGLSEDEIYSVKYGSPPLDEKMLKEGRAYDLDPNQKLLLQGSVHLSDIIRLDSEATYTRDFVYYKPWLLLVLISFFAFLGKSKEKYFWLLCAIVFALLCAGPYLMAERGVYLTGGGALIRLPHYYLFRYFPLFSKITWPYRAFPFTLTALVLLFSQGLAELFARVKSRIFKYAALLLITALTYEGSLYFSSVNFPLKAADTSFDPFYLRLREDRETAAVVVYPFTRMNLLKNMFYQSVHHKKMVSGTAPFYKLLPQTEARVDNNEVLRLLSRISMNDKVGYDPASLRDAVSYLADYKIKFIIINTAVTSAPVLSEAVKLLESLGMSVDYRSGSLLVYRIY